MSPFHTSDDIRNPATEYANWLHWHHATTLNGKMFVMPAEHFNIPGFQPNSINLERINWYPHLTTIIATIAPSEMKVSHGYVKSYLMDNGYIVWKPINEQHNRKEYISCC